MEDEVVVGFVPPYPPYNGFQAGLKPASTQSTMGRGEGHSPSPYCSFPLYQRH